MHTLTLEYTVKYIEIVTLLFMGRLVPTWRASAPPFHFTVKDRGEIENCSAHFDHCILNTGRRTVESQYKFPIHYYIYEYAPLHIVLYSRYHTGLQYWMV
jgi:hypothetical protein